MQIYKTIDIKTNLIYIGKDSKNDINYLGSGTIIQRVIKNRLKEYVENILDDIFEENKYTFTNSYKKEYLHLLFKKEILEDGIYKLEELKYREEYWIEYYNATDRTIGYNIIKESFGGDNFTNHPDKEIIRNNMKIRTKERFKDGMPMETKEKIRIANMGHIVTKETREKISKTRIERNYRDKNSACYGISNYDRWLIKYGKEEADKRKLQSSDNIRNANLKLKGIKYIIETPEHDIIEIIGRKDVRNFLKTNNNDFFTRKKYKGYKLLDKIKIDDKIEVI